VGCNLCYQICPDFCIDVALKPGISLKSGALKADVAFTPSAHARKN